MAYGAEFKLKFDGGKLLETFEKIKGALGNAAKGVDSFNSKLGKVVETAFGFNMLKGALEGVGQVMQGAIAPGIALDASLKDLSAIAGVTGSGLKEIEGYARSTAKTFGIEASGAVESYKLILSQLGPELAQNGAAMKTMGDHIATLSKTMGGDAAAAAGVLTTAMNQYKIDTSDATSAAQKMGEMMNVMSAAAKEGSAELPQINAALQTSGMVAKAAGVSFEELNATIQVLDKAGKKGAEGGVAVRNVLQEISKGRFTDKSVMPELQRYGISVDALADKNKTLSERLRMLAPLKKDSALLSKMFGSANSAAALAMLQGVEAIEEYTQKISGTNTAVEQADVIMSGYGEKVKKINAVFDDLKITLFNATKSFMPYLQGIGKGVSEAGLFAGSLFSIKRVMSDMNWSGMLKGIKSWTIWARISAAATAFWGTVTKAATTLSFKNILRQFSLVNIRTGLASVATITWGIITKGVIQGVIIPSFKALGRAIYSIPIIGWIAAIIGGLIWLGKYLWDNSKTFRMVLFGVWNVVKTVFGKAWEIVKSVFGKIWNSYKTVFGKIWSIYKWTFGGIWDGILWVWEKMKGFFGWIGDIFADVFKPILGFLNEWVLQPFLKVFGGIWGFIKKVFGWIGEKLGFIFKPIWALIKKVFGEGSAKGAKSWDDDHKKEGESTGVAGILGGAKKTATQSAATGAGKLDTSIGKDSNGGGGSGIKAITINVNNLIGVSNIANNNPKNTGMEVRKEVLAALAGALNDAQLALK